MLTLLGIIPIVFTLGASIIKAHHHHEGSYVAAVFEHTRFDSKVDPPRVVVDTNLDYYRRATEIAKSKGADVILFPEYGIFPPSSERANLKPFLEMIPDPRTNRVNPCEQYDLYEHKPILYALSCMARNNSIVVVANTGDIQDCKGETDCPEDGVFHFNTQVAFDRNGTLLVKYHKEHLFYEFGMDLARRQQDSTFVTDFGTFGTYICFDIDFGRMSEVGQMPNVDGIMFSTMWLDQFPMMVSVQMWESWASANNATILASNIQIPGYLAVGSGIFHGRDGPLAYTFNPDGISKLVVARVPKTGYPAVPPNSSITAISKTETWDFKGDGKDVPLDCSMKLLNESSEIYTDYRCMEGNITNYTFVKLSEPSGHVEACNNGMCCSVDYSTNGMEEHYYLGVFNGTYTHFTRYSWCEESCVLARCDAYGDEPCSVHPTQSNTLFRDVHLRANFTSKVVHPSILESGIRLLPRNEWDHNVHGGPEKSVHFANDSGRKLLSVGLRGRCYDKDPPYQR